MKTKKLLPVFLFLFCLILVFYYSCTKDVGKLSSNNPSTKILCDSVTYTKDILPIINAECAIPSCHVKGGAGNGNFTTYTGLSGTADPPLGDGSLRKRIVLGQSPPMPASGPIAPIEIQKINCWLNNGAPNN